jgi:hypothetical protein
VVLRVLSLAERGARIKESSDLSGLSIRIAFVGALFSDRRESSGAAHAAPGSAADRCGR